MAVELKKDLRVIVPYTLFTVGSLVALIMGKITVEVFLAILGALNVASAFGLKKDPPDDGAGGVGVPVNEAAGPSVQTFGSKRLPAVITPITMGLLMAGCASATPQQKADAADATYLGEMMACVEKSPTIQESRACRAEVRARWGVDAGGLR